MPKGHKSSSLQVAKAKRIKKVNTNPFARLFARGKPTGSEPSRRKPGPATPVSAGGAVPRAKPRTVVRRLSATEAKAKNDAEGANAPSSADEDDQHAGHLSAADGSATGLSESRDSDSSDPDLSQSERSERELRSSSDREGFARESADSSASADELPDKDADDSPADSGHSESEAAHTHESHSETGDSESQSAAERPKRERR